MSETLSILWVFSRIGAVGYGGGPGMIPLIEDEVVTRHAWMTRAEFADALAAGYALPGPIAAKIGVYVGYHVAGLSGAVAGFVGTLGPSLVMLAMVMAFLSHYADHPRVIGMLKGVRPIVVALMAWVVLGLLPAAIPDVWAGVVGLVALGVLVFTPIHPALLIVVGAIIGIVFYAP